MTRLSFISQNVTSLYSAKVFPKCLNQMSQVKEISIKLHEAKFPEACLNLSNCYNIEILRLDLALINNQSFKNMMEKCFNLNSELALPKIFKERRDYYYTDELVGLKKPEEEEKQPQQRQIRSLAEEYAASAINTYQPSPTHSSSDDNSVISEPEPYGGFRYNNNDGTNHVEIENAAAFMNRRYSANSDSFLAEDEELLTLQELHLTVRKNYSEEDNLWYVKTTDVFMTEPQTYQTEFKTFPKMLSKVANKIYMTLIGFDVLKIFDLN